MSGSGKVYLVGAGPGDPGLITVRGLDALRAADVVMFDRLAGPQLLDEARDDAELIDASKARGDHRMTQDEINRELVRLGKQGKTVCRLKGGDPFVFGRGGEEALALADAGIEWEVVPGVTSPIAAPAYAGIPVTQRGMAASFTIVTGSEDPDKPDSLIDWKALANVGGTLAFVMGWKSMDSIVSGLTDNGLEPSTPAALVQWGTTQRQRTVTASLSGIVSAGREAGISSPVVLVVGEVTTLRERLRWYDRRPLSGKTVLVTRARSQASRLAAKLEEHGAVTVQFPAIEIVPVDDPAELDDALAGIEQYDWLAFTSANAVRALTGRMDATGLDTRALGHVRVAAVGPATAAALAKIGIRPDIMPERFDAMELVAKFEALEISPRRVLFPRSSIGKETLPDGLRALGVRVDEVVAYVSRTPNGSGAAAVKAYEAGVDVTTFTSSSSVKNLMELLGGDPALINGSTVACIGPVTAETARGLGIEVDLMAEEQTIDGLVRTLVEAARAGAWR